MTASPHRTSDARFGARALLAGAALALVAVPFALLLFLVQDKWDPLLDVDAGARDDLHSVAVGHHWLVTALKVLSVLGSAWVYLPLFAAVAAWLVYRRLPRLALFVAVTMAGSPLLNAVVKLAVDRARPVLPDPVAHASGKSFPSGHAQSAMVAVGVLLLVFLPALGRRGRRVAVVLAVLWVLAIGFARVTLGVHYVSDVLAGYALGAAWVAAMAAAFNAWRVERGHAPADPRDGLEPGHGERILGSVRTGSRRARR
jgi:membrane-associated phospholipid phosphatase